jgi:hypothetical protein
MLASYGLISCDLGIHGLLHKDEYMYGHPFCVSDKIEFVFVSIDLFSKILSSFTSLSYILPFLFYSEIDNGCYLAVSVKSTTFKDLQKLGKEFLKIKWDFEKIRFISGSRNIGNYSKVPKILLQ